MEFSIKSGSPEKQRTACVVVGVFEHRKLSHSAELIDRASQGYLSDVLRRGDLDGKLGKTVLLYNVPGTLCDRVMLVGCGKEKDFRDKEYREVVRAVTTALSETGTVDASIYLTELPVKRREPVWRIEQAVVAVMESTYRFDQFKSPVEESKKSLKKMIFSVARRNELDAGEAAVERGLALAQGLQLARDLGNMPGNHCTPTYLAQRATEMAGHLGLKATVLEEADMQELGMGSLLSVSRGSRQPAKLIVLEYHGQDKAAEGPIVLVGKGVTFDSGGISLKPGEAMDEMKFDMCGAASVLGAMHAIASMKLPVNVVAIIPTTENLPDGDASKPGDIVRSMSGQTIEILNTDAEGRLILCDALTYAERFKPAAVIDVATLTGACVIALGHVASGLYGNNDGLVREIQNAAEEAADAVWHMPLLDAYQDQLKSNFADIANIGGRPAGSVTAACFLSRFTKNYEWAHLDIAGVAWKSGAQKGATGRPVALLTEFVKRRAGEAS